MGRDLYESNADFRTAFDAARLDFDLKSVCFDDPDGVINQTQYTQPCMVAFAAGVTAALYAAGVRPEYVAGLSLGEYSALQAAGVFDAATAVELAASGPFHTSLMHPAGDALQEKFRTVTFGEMQIPVLFNCLGRKKQTDETIPDLLVRQVQNSVFM